MSDFKIDLDQKNTDLGDQSADLTLSFVPIKALAMAMGLGPLIGLLITFQNESSLIALPVPMPLLVSFIVYIVLLVIFLMFLPNRAKFTLSLISKHRSREYLIRLRNTALVCTLFTFVIAGQYILGRQLTRGEVRAGLGLLGPIYAWVVKYAFPTIGCLTLIQWQACKSKSYKIKSLVSQIFLMMLVSGLMTGYKLTTVVMFLPTVCLFWHKISNTRKLLFASFAFSLITASRFVLSGGSGSTIIDSVLYVGARATIVAAYGVAASWEYSQVYDTSFLEQLIGSVFGKQISNFLLPLLGENKFSGNIPQLVTISYYPGYEAAKDGVVNLTLTIFGEAVVLLKDYWFVGIFVLFGLIYLLFYLCHKNFLKGKPASALLIFILIVFGVIPVVNSGGFFGLFSLPTFIYLGALYLLINFLMPKRWRMKTHSFKLSS